MTGEKIYTMDNPFFAFMGRMADLVILNLVFLLTSVPVLTIGPSLAAMHETLDRMAEGTEGALIHTYLQSWIRGFGRSMRAWLPLGGSGALMIFDLMISINLPDSRLQALLLAGTGSMLLLWGMIFSWTFVEPASMEEKGLTQLKKSLRRSVQKLPATLIMMAVELLPVLTGILFWQLFVYIVLPLYICIGCALSGEVCARIAAVRPEKAEEKDFEGETAV